jgi:hypothetical protein
MIAWLASASCWASESVMSSDAARMYSLRALASRACLSFARFVSALGWPRINGGCLVVLGRG